jgi:hypothetical protein
MGKKKKYKKLLEAAKVNPLVFRQTHEIHRMTGKQLIEEFEITEIDGKPVVHDQIYNYNFPVQIAVNHKRKLRKLVNTYGPEVVPIYQEAMQQN